MGDWVVDFTNMHDWAKEIPDIDPRSARLFTLWAEDTKTGKILGIVRGFYLIVPFTFDVISVRDYYSLSEEIPYYPMAIISSFKTTITDEDHIDELLNQMRRAIALDWKKVRKKAIKEIPRTSKLWKRYVLSFEDLIHYTIVCPSVDREVIDALNRLTYRMTGMMQIFSSPTAEYEEVTIQSHLRSVQKYLKSLQDNNRSS
jgi:hypothetical protein